MQLSEVKVVLHVLAEFRADGRLITTLSEKQIIAKTYEIGNPTAQIDMSEF
jgi:hypothetical protein